LAGDIARSDKQTRALVTRKIRDNIELIANLVGDNSQPDKRAKGKRQTDQGVIRAHAILTYCALVGGISVARAVSDEQLSQEILKLIFSSFDIGLPQRNHWGRGRQSPYRSSCSRPSHGPC